MSSSDYPFKSNFLDLGGYKYHYINQGQGEPLLFLHGNPTWSYYFRSLMSELEGSYRVIAPDHIGCGLSDTPSLEEYDYSLIQRAKDLENLIKHLGVNGKITLAVHDWGGMIGMLFAVRNPEMIKRFIIFNTSAFHLPKDKQFPWPLWICRDTFLGQYLVQGMNLFVLLALKWCCKKKKLSAEEKRQYIRPYQNWKQRTAVYQFVRDIPLKKEDCSYKCIDEVENNLDQFRNHPMLICWGMKDFVFDESFLRKWQEQFPGAETHKFPDAGHYIIEDEKEEILSLVKRFLMENP
ncbi:MAG: alpha/beta fold hydrolase [Vulcanimicrobiota bacterium]